MNIHSIPVLTRLIRHAALFGAALFACQPICSQTLNDTIRLPKGTVEGTLSNGLHYLVLPNKNPASRTEFRLVMRVGSVQQSDQQGGGAHFLEHMAFGGTTHFPNRQGVGYLESLGMKYGVDINAYTGFDRTIYMYAVPSDELKASSFAKPLSIIRDWMDQMTINPDRVETEKGIILEELRSTVEPDPFYNLKIGQGRFRQRMPLGTIDEVSRMTSQTLSAYYRKWYVPSLATIVVVGDVDPESMEREIHKQFASLKPGSAQDHKVYPLTYSPSQQIMIETDTLQPNDDIEIMIPHPCVVTRTIGDMRKKELGNLLVKTLTQRFNSRRIDCGITDTWYLSGTNHLVFAIKERKDQPLDTCIAGTSNELANILKNGFHEKEIEQALNGTIARLKRNSSSSYTSALWCDDFADYIISGDRYMTDSLQIDALCRSLESVTSTELQNLLGDWMNYKDSTMLVAVRTTPEKKALRTLESINAAWKKGEQQPFVPFVYEEKEKEEETGIETPEILKAQHTFDPSCIARTIDYDELGIREVQLRNGITLIMRPTNEEGGILFSSFTPGGLASIPTDEYHKLEGAASYIDMGGIAKAPIRLGDYMYQNNMSLAIAMENNWHGFMGSFDAGKTGEYFNLIYEKITDPELRYKDFEDIRKTLLESLGEESILTKMLNRAPDRMLSARLNELMGNTLNNLTGSPTRKQIEDLSLDTIARYYREIYSQPNNSVYVICGDFNPDSITQAFVPVFSRFPKVKRPIYRKTPRLELPEKTLTERFPNENKTQTIFDYLYYGTYKPNLRNSLELKLMSNIVRNRLISELRERESLVYSPYIGLFYEGIPRNYYYFDVSSSADNKNMARINELLHQMLTDLQNTPVEEEELNALKQSFLITKRETLDGNSSSAWRTTITSLLKNGESLKDFARYEDILGSITPKDLQKAFKKYMNPERFALLYMSNQDVELQ